MIAVSKDDVAAELIRWHFAIYSEINEIYRAYRQWQLPTACLELPAATGRQRCRHGEYSRPLGVG